LSKEKEKAVVEKVMYEVAYNEALIEALQKQIEQLNSSITEISLSIETLNELKKGDKGVEVLVPIGRHVLVKMNLEKADKVLLSLGASVLVEKPVDAALEELEEERKKQMQLLAQQQENLRKLVERNEALRAYLNSVLQEKEGA